MNYFLSLIICSSISGTCLPPINYDILHKNFYNCSISGYKESIKILENIGEEEVNKYDLYAKFYCIEKVKKNEDI
jgi:hypothetical protein